MPSPFPGMDPFIEATGLWEGFHNSLISEFSRQLNAHLPENYAAIVDVRIEITDTLIQRAKQRRPDVGVVKDFEPNIRAGTTTSAVLDLEPAPLTFPEFDAVREAFIEIVALPNRELITSIELLSPTNKSTDRGEYLRKRAAMVQQEVNLVEIDLLLGGERLSVVEPLPAGDFYAFVTRRNRWPRCDVFFWPIRRALPRIPIPLREPDGDILLDLATAFQSTYDSGRYRQLLRYELDLPRTLSAADREWASQLVRTLSGTH